MTTNIRGGMSPFHLAFNAMDDATQQRIFAEMGRNGGHELIRQMNQDVVASVRDRLARNNKTRRNACCA